jgi:hypothetical protein
MPGPLEVRLRATAPGVRGFLTALITAVTSALFVVGGAAHPATFGGVLFILLGVAGLALCAAGALVFLGQATGRRPVLELDDQGVRVPAVWPRSRRADRVLPWPDLAAVCAWSQGPPSGSRGGSDFPHHLAFLPAAGSPATSAAISPATGGEGRTPPENGAELLAVKVADVACVPTLRWAVPVRPGWDTTVEEVAKAVRNHRADVPFIDRRDLPKPRKKRKPPTRRPAPPAAP